MRPFPPEDGLERVKVYSVVDLPVFGNLLVLGEFFLPFGISQRRNHAMDRLPLGDGEPGIGQPRRAAHHHKGKQDDKNRIEPGADECPVALFPLVQGDQSFCACNRCHGLPGTFLRG